MYVTEKGRGSKRKGGAARERESIHACSECVCMVKWSVD